MSKNIKLKIFLPNKVYKDVNVDKVQFSAYEGEVTILPLRAPSVFVLEMGQIKILSEDNAITDSFFMKSGVAQYADGVCKIMLEEIIDYKEISLETAKKLENETLGDEKEYYKYIIDTININNTKR